MLGLNALLTGGIIGRILCVSCYQYLPATIIDLASLSLIAHRVRAPKALQEHRLPYAVVIEAIIESALVNCVGLLLYELSTIAPTGRIEVGRA